MKSSRIRALLREGRVEEARHLLGRLYGAYGVVVEGTGWEGGSASPRPTSPSTP